MTTATVTIHNTYSDFDVIRYGADGTGETDSILAINKAIADAAVQTGPGSRVVEFDGTFAISAPIVIPPHVTLRGVHAVRGPNNQKAAIKALPGFIGAAMIRMTDGYPEPSYGQRIFNLTLDGSAAKANTLFSGIKAEGEVRGVVLRDVSITDVSDRGILTTIANNKVPFSWHMDNVQINATGSDGFRLAGMTDSTIVNSRSIGAGRHGFYIDGMANSMFTNCRAEWSKENGWYVTASWGTGTGSGGAVFTGISTDRNGKNGILIDAVGSAPFVFNGVMLRRDGRNGGTGGGGYAGLAVNATTPVVVTGLSVYPGVDDDGTKTTSPQIGVRVAGSTWVSIDSGYVHAATTAIQDAGSNTKFYVGTNIGKATGSTSAPVRV